MRRLARYRCRPHSGQRFTARGEEYEFAASIGDGAVGLVRNRYTARVKTYGDVLCEYEFHPESKCADAGGNPSGKEYIGLLQRRHIGIGQIRYIGKESNRLEDVESGLAHSVAGVYTEYPDPQRDEWQTKILPALNKLPLSRLVKKSGMSRRALIDLRAGRSRPHRRNQELLGTILRTLG